MALELAYHHARDGTRISGSIDTLIDGIVQGRRVRIVFKDETTADSYVATDTVSAKVFQEPRLVRAVLPIRPAVGSHMEMNGPFALFGAVMETTGKYLWQYGPPLTNTPEPGVAALEARWFLE